MLQCAVQSHKSAVHAQEDAAQQPRPCFGSVDVGKDNLKRVIGPQGATVKGLEAGARAKIVAAEGGVVHLYARSAQALAALQAQVEAMTGAGIKVRRNAAAAACLLCYPRRQAYVSMCCWTLLTSSGCCQAYFLVRVLPHLHGGGRRC